MDEKTEKQETGSGVSSLKEHIEDYESVEPTSKAAAAATDFEVEGPEPTEEDWKQLREVSDKIPYSAYLVILIEFCERFTYYGLSGPFQNYIQYPDPGECEFNPYDCHCYHAT